MNYTKNYTQNGKDYTMSDKKIAITKKEFGLRLARLRQEKDVSARKMSMELAQNKNYITSIESGNNYPTMQSFFNICEYLNIEPKDFFDMHSESSILYNDFLELAATLSPCQLQHLYLIAYDLKYAKESC